MEYTRVVAVRIDRVRRIKPTQHLETATCDLSAAISGDVPDEACDATPGRVAVCHGGRQHATPTVRPDAVASKTLS